MTPGLGGLSRIRCCGDRRSVHGGVVSFGGSLVVDVAGAVYARERSGVVFAAGVQVAG